MVRKQMEAADSRGIGSVTFKLPGDTDEIEWTFQRPGKYVMLVESGGDRQSFSLRIGPSAGLATTLPLPVGHAPVASSAFSVRHSQPTP